MILRGGIKNPNSFSFLFFRIVIIFGMWWRNIECGNPHLEWAPFTCFQHCVPMASCKVWNGCWPLFWHLPWITAWRYPVWDCTTQGIYPCWDSGFPSQMANRDVVGIASLSELQLWREQTSGSAGECMDWIPPCPCGLGCSMGAVSLL